ncbi:hypothetical protein DPMN_146309 [Dreissena polymorpha]|uniref:Uncharacterized protein n=1 Tax=Dreissena polymorpha TaxID=45954 RepID=A0A9D4FA32_DREPO|nr:hypothetical protein DPMN_146309 [Dreissena polymorpha]
MNNKWPPGGHHKNVTSRVKKTHPCGHVLLLIQTIFKLNRRIQETNVLTTFHEDWATELNKLELEINVAFRLLTRFYYSQIKPYNEICPAPGGHVFKATKTIFELIQDIIGTHLLAKFHDDRKKNMTSRPRPRGGHVFQPTGIIFELVQDIFGMNLLTEFHEDRTINVASRMKNAPPLGGHVFQANITIFELIQDIIKTNLLTIFHQDWTINVASREKCPAPGGHVFKPTGIIFELVQDIIGMNLLTKFHEDWTINVASRVHKENAPPLGSHVFSSKDISGTNLLKKFHEDWKINEKCPAPGGHVFQPTGIIFELIQDIIGMNLLKIRQ